MLNWIVSRMNKQLDRYKVFYQGKELPEEDKQDLDKEGFEEVEEFVIHAANHPLLASYEEYIAELETANQNFKVSFESLKAENEKLQKKLISVSDQLKDNELTKLREEISGEIEGMQILEGTARGKEIYQILESLKDEQRVLLDEIELTKEKGMQLEEELKSQTQLAKGNAVKAREWENRYYKLEADRDSAVNEKDSVKIKIGRQAEELKEIKIQREELYHQKIRLEEQVKILQKSIDQYKTNCEDLEARRMTDIEHLEKELNEKGITVKDFKDKYTIQGKEIEQLKELNKNLQRDLEQTKNDAAQMLKIMEENESKGALFEEKERLLKVREQEARHKMEEAKIKEAELTQKEIQYKKQIIQLEEQWRQDLEEKQKTYEEVLGTAKAKQKTLLRKREDECSELCEENTRLQASLRKLQSDFRALEDENRNLKATLTDEQRGAVDKCKSYERQLKDIQCQESEEKRRLQGQLDSSQRVVSSLEERLKEAEQEAKRYKKQSANLEMLVNTKEGQIRDLKTNLQELSLDKESGIREIERMTISHKDKCNELRDAYTSKVCL